MKAFLYKLISSFFLPPLFNLFILTMGLILIVRKKTFRWGKRILMLGIIILYLSSSFTVVNLLSKPLESPFPQPYWESIPPSVGAIVVLTGGKLYTKIRTLRGVELYYQLKNLPLLFSGGPASRDKDSLAESKRAGLIAQKLGVPQERIIVESRSRNTYENAVYSLIILRRMNIKDFILVTSGSHMRRAMAVFKKNGATPVPVPSDYISSWTPQKKAFFPDYILPTTEAFNALFYVLHEYFGLVWYKTKGYI